MTTRETIINQFLNSSSKPKQRYLSDFIDNIIPTVSKKIFYDKIYPELKKGDGKELIDGDPKSKFNAIYSSSALAVNFFGVLKIKENLDNFSILKENGFKVSAFEKKLPTGLRGNPPNLDFFLKNEKSIIGIESKFLEILNLKVSKFSLSYSENFLGRIDKGLIKVVNHYRKKNEARYLDVAQLTKHSIGLLNNKEGRQVKLLYVFWKPKNFTNYHEYSIHDKELDEFSNIIKTVGNFEFHYTDYHDLSENYIRYKHFCRHISFFKQKYQIS